MMYEHFWEMNDAKGASGGSHNTYARVCTKANLTALMVKAVAL